MTSWRRAILIGLVVWLVPFLVAIAAFPLKQSWRSLFESIMPVTLAIVVVFCAQWYFRRVATPTLKEGLCLGLLWLAICVVIDVPLMVNDEMKYTIVEYLADIGLTYVMIPVITMGMAGVEPKSGETK